MQTSPAIEERLPSRRLAIKRASGVAWLALLLVAALAHGGCRPKTPPPKNADPMTTAVAPTAKQLATFSQRSAITIPESAEAVRFHSNEGTDGAMWLQIRIPASQFLSFMKTTPIPAAAVRPGPAGAQPALYAFRAWLPVPPKKFRYADAQIAPWRWMKCIFDFDDPKTTVVYLMWYTT